MKIAFVSRNDSAHLTLASQHSYFLSKCLLDLGHEIEHVSPLRLHEPILSSLYRRLFRLSTGKRILLEREPMALDDLASQVAEKLSRIPVDLVFSDSTLPISHLKTDKPIVFWADATFAGMLGFYPGFSRLSEQSIRNGNLAEQRAISKAAFALYTSEWARQTCLLNYAVDPEKVKVVPRGANLLNEPMGNEVETAIKDRGTTPCHLLFVGLDWARKNGQAAVLVATELNRRGLRTILTIIGDKPKTPLPSYVHCLGILNKEHATNQTILREAYSKAHFLLLPARAEALGRVLMEANAFGVPCLVTDVGGISSYIKNDKNGRVFDNNDHFVRLAADYIQTIMASEKMYTTLARRSYETYLESGTWKVVGEQLETLLARL